MNLCTFLRTVRSLAALVCALALIAAAADTGEARAYQDRTDGGYGAYVLRQLAEACGYSVDIRLGRGPVAYAQALTIDDRAIILYNPRHLDDLERETGNPWSAVSVLAHELGHHYYGHAHVGVRDTDPEQVPQNELDADYFSGYVLARVGATLRDAQAAQRSLNSDEGLFHPSSSRRLRAIRAGWVDGAAGIPLSPEPELRMESENPGRALTLRASSTGVVWERLSLLNGQW